jgi:hypothetical protein
MVSWITKTVTPNTSRMCKNPPSVKAVANPKIHSATKTAANQIILSWVVAIDVPPGGVLRQVETV